MSMSPEELIRLYHEGLTRDGCAGPMWFMCVLIVVAFLMGCKQTEYIPVKEVHTEYVHSHDTVHHHDTTHTERETVIREANKGDSAMLAKYGIQLRENERLIMFLQKELERVAAVSYEHSHDSVMKGDSIPVPYPVEKKLTPWQQTKQDYGGYALVAVAGVILWIILRARRKLIS